MPNYYNPYLYNTAQTVAPYYNPYPSQQVSYGGISYGVPANTYWISVDGEMAARAWQMPANLPPNTIIPLWDLDGQHVYFKSTDAYGRINPLRKGHVVFDDESANLSAGQANSEASVNVPSGTNYVGNSSASAPDMSKYVTKDDFDGLRHEIQDLIRGQKSQNNNSNTSYTNNQNGNKNRGDYK